MKCVMYFHYMGDRAAKCESLSVGYLFGTTALIPNLSLYEAEKCLYNFAELVKDALNSIHICTFGCKKSFY